MRRVGDTKFHKTPEKKSYKIAVETRPSIPIPPEILWKKEAGPKVKRVRTV